MNDNLQPDELKAGFWVGEWLAEPSLNRISREGEDVAVEPKVMEVLVFLALNPGQTVTKDSFFETVWDGMVVTEDVLSRCISELRKNLGDDSRDPRYIETIRKTGYRLIAPVTNREPGAVPDQRRRQPPVTPRAKSSTESTGAASAAPRSRRRWPVVLFVMLVLISGGYLAYTRLTPEPEVETPSPVITPFTSLPGLEIDPSFSPDGQKIAFASDDNGQRNFDIYIKQEGSEKALRLTDDSGDDRYPAWSPDGLFIAFVRSAGGSNAVYLVPSLGGQERKIADLGLHHVQGTSWSPDGRRLAVSIQREPFGAYSIFLVRVDTTSLARITTPPQYHFGDVAPRFSPDGKSIAFARCISEDVQDLFLYSLDTGELKQITFDSAAIAGLDWMPDAKSIVFASRREDGSGLWRVNLTGGEPYGIAAADPGTSYESPSIAKGGSRLTYVHRNANVNIWRLFKPRGFPGLRARPAVFTTHWDSQPDISPDGDRIAFASTQSGHREIWVADTDGRNQAQITMDDGGAKAPKWSPEGTELAFQWTRNGQTDIYLVSAEGGPPSRLTKSPSEDTVPVWSRDGRAVYFSSNRSGRWELWRISKTGGDPEQITRHGGRFGMESRDGTSIYFVRPDTTGVWRRKLDSPDEPRMVFAKLDPRDWANWSVAPSGIYFVERQGFAPTLSFYGFQSRRTTRLQTLDKVPADPALATSADFSWFAYAQVDDEGSDIMVLENIP